MQPTAFGAEGRWFFDRVRRQVEDLRHEVDENPHLHRLWHLDVHHDDACLGGDLAGLEPQSLVWASAARPGARPGVSEDGVPAFPARDHPHPGADHTHGTADHLSDHEL